MQAPLFMEYYVYIVKGRDGSLYTGSTRDLEKRIFEHNFSKLGARSLKNKRPVELVYYEIHSNWSNCLKREKEIKGWRRDKKVDLIKCACAERSEAGVVHR